MHVKDALQLVNTHAIIFAGEYTTTGAMLRPLIHNQTDTSFSFRDDQVKVSSYCCTLHALHNSQTCVAFSVLCDEVLIDLESKHIDFLDTQTSQSSMPSLLSMHGTVEHHHQTDTVQMECKHLQYAVSCLKPPQQNPQALVMHSDCVTSAAVW